MELHERRTYKLAEAIEMLDKKKGAGKSKTTRVMVELDIQFKGSITETTSYLKTLEQFAYAIAAVAKTRDPEADIEISGMVSTEMEDNEDWEDNL
jgi:hypothetical protein